MGKVFGTCAFRKLRISYAVVGYNIESCQVNTHPPSQQKYLLSSELLISNSSFPANCCKNYFLGEHSDGCFLVCFLLQYLLVVLVFCLVLGIFICLVANSAFFFNYYFYFLNVLLYIKRAELKTIRGREAREFYVTKSFFWYIKHRDTARLCYHFINLFFLIKISL